MNWLPLTTAGPPFSLNSLLVVDILHSPFCRQSQVDRRSVTFVSNMSYTNDPNYPSSGYPPPPHSQYPNSDEYKASYDDLVDQYAQPYAKTSQHQTFSPALGSAARQPPFMGKQSYSSEMSAKDSEEGYMPSSSPRIIPMKEEKVADTRTIWQKVSIHPLIPIIERTVC